MKTDLVWRTAKMRVCDLIPWEGNPRRMTEKQATDLRESIERLNLMSIPVADIDGRLVSGHQRMRILHLLGRSMEEIDVRVPNRKLTEQEYKEANLRENKNVGEWDEDLLAHFDHDFLLEVGFDEEELNDLFDLAVERGGRTEPDDIPDDPEDIYVKVGDVYDLEGHILVCGDSTDGTLIESLKKAFPPSLVFTDPPYGVSVTGGRSEVVRKKKIKEIKNDGLRGKELYDFYRSFLDYYRMEGLSLYMCYGHQSQVEAISAVKEAGFTYFGTIVWNKNVFGLSGFWGYRPKHEFIVYAFYGKDCTWTGRNDQPDVWDIARPKERPGSHPTPKPVEIPLKAILNSSHAGGFVYDPFLGVGATLIACEQLRRKCVGIDIEPKYIQTSIERWEKFTGKKAVKK